MLYLRFLLIVFTLIFINYQSSLAVNMANNEADHKARHETVSSHMPPLSPDEERIILKKGTERPYSGKYNQEKRAGTYVCRQCGNPLYHSRDKFESNCGWPAFDDEIANAVNRTLDADGIRTEITCANCNGHLGHIFLGENFTPKNTRHCVNSLSLQFIPSSQPLPLVQSFAKEKQKKQKKVQFEDAYFAGGCFWAIEDSYEKLPGVLDAVSGYAGGDTLNPSYQEVSTGQTGHAETVRVTFDPKKISYETLARIFFEIHDPTQLNRQGNDIGSQYRSIIFYTSKEQKEIAENLITTLKARGFKVVTEVRPYQRFYKAENVHQNFTARTGRGACTMRVARFGKLTLPNITLPKVAKNP